MTRQRWALEFLLTHGQTILEEHERHAVVEEILVDADSGEVTIGRRIVRLTPHAVRAFLGY